MTDRLIRLMRIITIVQAKPGILARELAERCGTSERTIYRDMDALSAMHIPITHQGYGKGYKFIGDFALYPLDWTDEEAKAFAALQTIIEHLKPILPKGFESAYEKVMAVSHKQRAEKDEHQEQQEQEQELEHIEEKENNHLVQSEKIAVQMEHHLIPIMMASLSQNTIEARYKLPGRTGLFISKIDPYLLIPWRQHFYLLGRNHDTNKMYTYQLNRFRQVRILEERFAKLHMNLQEGQLGLSAMAIDHRGPVAFKIKLSSALAKYFKDGELFKNMRTAEWDNSFVFDVTVSDVVEFLNWLSQFGAEVEILEPADYRELMRENLQKWLALYR